MELPEQPSTSSIDENSSTVASDLGLESTSRTTSATSVGSNTRAFGSSSYSFGPHPSLYREDDGVSMLSSLMVPTPGSSVMGTHFCV